MENKITVQIEEIQWNESGYTWRLSVKNNLGILEHGTYNTNSHGRGLWKENHQILGTFEFELSGSQREATNQIKKYFKEKWQYGLSQRLSNKTRIQRKDEKTTNNCYSNHH